jgi:chromate reductase
MKIIALSGSLRNNSFNTGLLRAAAEIAREADPSVIVEIISLDDIPMYNSDLETGGLPASVQRLKDSIAEADAVMIATPEYNHSISGVLKNALDWISRGPVRPLTLKPVAIMGASTGAFGTIRAQGHLRDMLHSLNARTVSRPEILVGGASAKFDANGTLTDETTRGFLQKLVEALMQSVPQEVLS